MTQLLRNEDFKLPGNDARLIDIAYSQYMLAPEKITTTLETRLLAVLPLLDYYSRNKEFYLPEYEVFKTVKSFSDEDRKQVSVILRLMDSNKLATDPELSKQVPVLYNRYLMDYYSHMLMLKTTFAKIEPQMLQELRLKSKYSQTLLEDFSKIIARYPAGYISANTDEYEKVDVTVLISTCNQVGSKLRLLINTHHQED